MKKNTTKNKMMDDSIKQKTISFTYFAFFVLFTLSVVFATGAGTFITGYQTITETATGNELVGACTEDSQCSTGNYCTYNSRTPLSTDRKVCLPSRLVRGTACVWDRQCAPNGYCQPTPTGNYCAPAAYDDRDRPLPKKAGEECSLTFPCESTSVCGLTTIGSFSYNICKQRSTTPPIVTTPPPATTPPSALSILLPQNRKPQCVELLATSFPGLPDDPKFGTLWTCRILPQGAVVVSTPPSITTPPPTSSTSPSLITTQSVATPLATTPYTPFTCSPNQGDIIYSSLISSPTHLESINSMKKDGTQEKVLFEGNEPFTLAVTKDKCGVAFSTYPITDKFEIKVMNADGTNIRVIETVDHEPNTVSFSDDGKKLAYQATYRNRPINQIHFVEIHLVDLEQRTIVTIPTTRNNINPALSYNGQKVAYIEEYWNTARTRFLKDLKLYDTSTQAITSLTTENEVGSFAWSPRFMELAYTTHPISVAYQPARPDITTIYFNDLENVRQTTIPGSVSIIS